ncbi:MAG TPA: fatty acid desaturase [Bordetella sp.]
MEKNAPFRLKAQDVMPLSAKSDLPGLLRASGHLGAIVLADMALWHALGTWWAVPLTFLSGYVVAFLFCVEHETAHQTAFRTRALNYVFGHLASLAILYPYEYYRAFHWDHHRYTQDPARDPELAVPQPASLAGIAWACVGMAALTLRVRKLLEHAAGRANEPWVPDNKRALVVLEARCYLLVYALVAVASIATGSLAALWLWLLPLLAGQCLMRPYLMSEHVGCLHDPDTLANTRTTYTNAVVRFFAWNMPYHAEHHTYPSVPFHALPKLNVLLAGHIANTEQGYIAAFSAVLRHLTRRGEADAQAKA